MHLGNARGQVHVAHLPAGNDAAALFGGDDVIGPRIVARVTVRTQVVGISGLPSRRRVAVVAVDLDEAVGGEAPAFGVDSSTPKRAMPASSRIACDFPASATLRPAGAR